MAGTAQRNANPYFVGERTIQKGKKAGIKEPLMILIAAETATEIGMPKESGFPQTVGGIRYEIKNRGVIAQGKRKNKSGQDVNFERIVSIQRGAKSVTVYLNKEEPYTYTQQGVTVTGKRPKSVQIGFPQGASAIAVHDFLKKATNVVRFSFGGSPYDIIRGGNGGAA
jgi:hypothetical protein